MTAFFIICYLCACIVIEDGSQDNGIGFIAALFLPIPAYVVWATLTHILGLYGYVFT